MPHPTQLTAAAKAHLSSTIRGLHDLLLRDLHAEVEGTYRMSLPMAKAKLDEERGIRRQRFEAWLEERARTLPTKDRPAALGRFRLEAEKEAAYTFLHRIVFLRQLEHFELSRPPVLTGGWRSKGYQQFRDFAPGLLDDGTEGYATLLRLLFEELSYDLPGLFGDVGVSRLIRIPPATLRAVITQLDDAELASAWGDDTTLGWVYQYWNDPDREALDRKIADGGKIEPHEIASKTQMFTERYMVEWLLQNSLGATWLAMCRKNGWRADAEAVLPALDARRAAWREQREAGTVALDALMPIQEGLEDRWKYFVPQPIPEAVVESAPESIRKLKLLDPACGSGHFLVIAFDLLAAMYHEEARHRGESWSDSQIAQWIIENNLHGVDIDPRPIQIAAAALYLKARVFAPDTRFGTLNLVASNLRLADLAADDPALVQLRRELRTETGIPETLTDRIVQALKGADHLGSLLKVDKAIDDAVRQQEADALVSTKPAQGDIFTRAFPAQQKPISVATARKSVLDRLENFLHEHGGEQDLGLRLDGEQLAAGLRFMRIVKEGTYDVLVGNPPYQGTSKMKDAKYVAANYPRGKADLYAAFLERGLELARAGGVSAMVTMRGWMFLTQFTAIRENLLRTRDLRLIGDVDRGAFESVPNEVLAASMSIFRKQAATGVPSVAMQPTPLSDKSYDRARTERKRAAVLAQVGRFEFEVERLKAVGGQPVIYWWDRTFVESYRLAPKFGSEAAVRQGAATSDNPRFLRMWWEVERLKIYRNRTDEAATSAPHTGWVPYVKGGAGRAWMEEIGSVLLWSGRGLELKLYAEALYGSYSRTIKNERWYFEPGISYTSIGTFFCARLHRYRSVIGHAGSSAYTSNMADALCLLNSSTARTVLSALNPSLRFEVGDVNRLPSISTPGADRILGRLISAFDQHLSIDESKVDFRRPNASNWEYTQKWAQEAVDRRADEPLPPFAPAQTPARPVDFVSFAIGVALGRFGSGGEGILDATSARALPHGLLFLSAANERDSLTHESTRLLRDAWHQYGIEVAGAVTPAAGIAMGIPYSEPADLRDWLRTGFFKHHKEVYENRPIYFPLSSEKRNFVAWCSIHRWNETPGGALQALLADHLLPERRAIDGQLADAREKKLLGKGKEQSAADKRVNDLQKLRDELEKFIASVTELLEKGPPQDDAPREADARHAMDLDDGVMVNSAALWPLLEPQWKDPKKWWKQLAAAKGKKDYDWSHLAARYFPKRVDA